MSALNRIVEPSPGLGTSAARFRPHYRRRGVPVKTTVLGSRAKIVTAAYVWSVLISGIFGRNSGAELHPDISIVGVAKCGTSHMYTILKSHADTVALPKEWCPKNVSRTQLQSFHESVRERLSESGGRTTVAACINAHKSYEYFSHVKRASPGIRPKFIYMLRDPADLLWASFNFWTNPGDARRDTFARWTEAGASYRSPGYFHELLLSEGRVMGGINVTFEFLAERYFLSDLEAIIGAAGRGSVLILESSQLQSQAIDSTLRELARFNGLRLSGFDLRKAHAATNSGHMLDSRGFWAVSDVAPVLSGIYEISGFRPMLPATRRYIYSRAREFCRHVYRQYGIAFKRCLDSGERRKVSTISSLPRLHIITK